jgi:sec-independent protein translocase protein TatA
MLTNGFGWPHLLIVAAVFVLFFGAKKMPDMARSLGRSMRIIKAETAGLHHDEQTTTPVADTSTTPSPTAPTPTQSPQTTPQPDVEKMQKQLDNLQKQLKDKQTTQQTTQPHAN